MAGTAKGGVSLFNAKNDGIGISPLYPNATVTIPADVQGKLDAASRRHEGRLPQDLPGQVRHLGRVTI